MFSNSHVWQNGPDSALGLRDRKDRSMALKSLSIAKLQDLKRQVEAAISTKVSERRHEVESELSKLDGHSGGARRGRSGKSHWHMYWIDT
jgi:hypothetical protein